MIRDIIGGGIVRSNDNIGMISESIAEGLSRGSEVLAVAASGGEELEEDGLSAVEHL